MSQDDGRDIERLLSEAFDAQARSRVPDHRVPPMMPVSDQLSPHRHRRHRSNRPGRVARWVAPLAAAAAVLIVVAVVLGLSGGSARHGNPGAAGSPTVRPPTSAATSSSVATSPRPKPATGKPVHVSLKFGDGTHVGVGMPIIAFLSRPIKDARAFAQATVVTVNGRAVSGGWYFEKKFGDAGHPIEADFRMQQYWPAHAKIHMALKVKGISAGTGLVFANDLSLDFATGAANIATVDDATHKLTVMSDGQRWGTFDVSLGAKATPTRSGTKIIMEKGRSICMHGPGYNECGVKFTQRLTYDGEYLHAAPWNSRNIAQGVDSSNGCTNLGTADAQKLFDFLEIGDVVRYPNAKGPAMQLGDGYGDWTVLWAQWQTGGLYKTS